MDLPGAEIELVLWVKWTQWSGREMRKGGLVGKEMLLREAGSGEIARVEGHLREEKRCSIVENKNKVTNKHILLYIAVLFSHH